MKKYRLLLIVFIFIVFLIIIYVLSNDFKPNFLQLSYFKSSKSSLIVDKFDNKYALSKSLEKDNFEQEKEITELTKKTTYLLLGDINNQNESSEEYYKRHKEYQKMASYNYFPKDKNSTSGYDESNPLYNYVIISEWAIPQLFNSFNELGIIYNSYGDIRVTVRDDLVISTLTLPDVKIKTEDKENPLNYTIEKTNLIICYYFIKIDDNYRLTYLYGDKTDNVKEYFNEIEDNETKNSMSTVSATDSYLSKIFNFDKLNSISDNEINNIYNLNMKNTVYLRSYYNNKVIANANGIFINDGIVLTTWSFIEKSLFNSQYLTIRNNEGKTFDIDGIITANPETDVALIKLKETTGNYVKLGVKDSINIEEPVFTINSKSGVGQTIQKGIIVANDNYLQTSIPLSENDEGSPLFNKSGHLIGMNTSKSTDSFFSLAINLDVIKEIQDKFYEEDFASIKTISFEKLKEEYYMQYDKEQIVNSIPKSIWKTYSKIGNLEKNIKLELVKASYKDKIVSLRYRNDISNYIPNIQLSTSFREQLIKDGYIEKLNNSSKCIYENGKYKVIIMSDFNYLIIVMVKI